MNREKKPRQSMWSPQIEEIELGVQGSQGGYRSHGRPLSRAEERERKMKRSTEAYPKIC